jgi:isoleucyl-tRNA synthetase
VDKRAAYQTLYTVLTTLCKLMAPCVPFVTEVMWQNLRLPTDPESVHLADFPPSEKSLADEQLTKDMKAVQNVVSLGLSARQAAKINVRQPLAELVVSPGSEADWRAAERFFDLITDELNMKCVRLHIGSEPLLKVSAKLNKKTAASKLGAKLKEAEDALAKMSAADLDASPFVLVGVELAAGDVVREFAAAPGWCGVADRGTQVAVSTTITPELKLEGLARDVVRQVQNERKNAKLDLLDKIALHLHTEAPELAQALEAHRGTIATAVQATEWSAAALGEGAHAATVKIDGHPLIVQLRKV